MAEHDYLSDVEIYRNVYIPTTSSLRFTLSPGSKLYPEVDVYADLPAASAGNSGWVYLVLNNTFELIFFNTHPAGLYVSNGTTWEYIGATPASMSDNVFKLYDGDNITKQMAFNLENISMATTRILTMANKDIDLGNFSHNNNLVDLDLAAAGVTYGHIDDQTQTIAGNKTFSGTTTLATPFTLGATSVTSTGTQLNYLNAAAGITGTASTNIVFSTSPTITSPTINTSITTNYLTTGSVLFAGASGEITQDNANLFWDNTTNTLYTGTNTTYAYGSSTPAYLGMSNYPFIATNSMTNTTDKFGRYMCMHYDTAEEPLTLFHASSTVAYNTGNFGGGTSIGNSCSLLNFYVGKGTATGLSNITGVTIQSFNGIDGNKDLVWDATAKTLTFGGGTGAAISSTTNSRTSITATDGSVLFVSYDISALPVGNQTDTLACVASGRTTTGTKFMEIHPTGALLAGSGVVNPIFDEKFSFVDSDATVYASTDASSIVPWGGVKLMIGNTSATDNSQSTLLFRALTGAGSTFIGYNTFISGSTAYTTQALAWGFRSGSAAYSERIRLWSSGEFVVGSDAKPTLAEKLSVVGDSYTKGRIMTSTENLDANGGFYIVRGTARNKVLWQDTGDVLRLYNVNNNSLVLGTNGTARLTITNNGRSGLSATRLSDSYPHVMEFIDDATAYNGTNPGAGIALFGLYSSTSQKAVFATIQGIKENATDGNYAGALRFMTRAYTSTAVTERMRISSNGYVGIGTTAPSGHLEVAGGIIASGDFIGYASLNADSIILDAGATKAIVAHNGTVRTPIAFYASDFTFEPKADGTGIKTYINTNGQVGIGTNTFIDATTKLQILMPDDVSTNAIVCKNSDGKIELYNGTSTADKFSPIIRGYSAGADRGTYLIGDVQAGNDSGTVPALYIRGQIGNAALATRPVLKIKNYTTSLFTISSAGSVGVNIGDASPAGFFHIKTPTTVAHALFLDTTDATGNVYIGFGQKNTRRGFLQFDNAATMMALANEYGGIRFYTGTSGPETLKASILSTGSMLLGPTMTAVLDTAQTAANPILNIAAPNGNCVMQLQAFDDGVGTSMLVLSKSDSDTIGTLSETDKDDVLGIISFEGVNSSSSMAIGADIISVQSGAAGATYIPAHIIFKTATSSADRVERMRITSDGKLSTGAEALPDVSSGGLCLNQGTFDTNILSFKSSDVAHGITDIDETDTYFSIIKKDAAAGGTLIKSYTESNIGLQFLIVATTEITTDTNTSLAAASIISSLKNGTGAGSFGNTANIFSVSNASTTRFIIKGNGDIHATNTTITALDDEDDLELANASKWAMSGEQGKMKIDKKHFKRLQELGIFNKDGDMWNMQKMQTLNLGALGQLANMVKGLAKKIGLSEQELYQLAKGV